MIGIIKTVMKNSFLFVCLTQRCGVKYKSKLTKITGNQISLLRRGYIDKFVEDELNKLK